MKGYLVIQLYIGSFDGGSVMVSTVALKLQEEVRFLSPSSLNLPTNSHRAGNDMGYLLRP